VRNILDLKGSWRIRFLSDARQGIGPLRIDEAFVGKSKSVPHNKENVISSRRNGQQIALKWTAGQMKKQKLEVSKSYQDGAPAISRPLEYAARTGSADISVR
jgi:hypothetical protein